MRRTRLERLPFAPRPGALAGAYLLALLSLAPALLTAQRPERGTAPPPAVARPVAWAAVVWAPARQLGRAPTAQAAQRADAVASEAARVRGRVTRAGAGHPSLGRHLGVGLVVGAGAGAGWGLWLDSDCQDCMIPATPFTTALGAGAGLLVGGIVYLVRAERAERP